MDGCVYGIDYGDALWMYTYVQTHLIIYIKCVPLFLCQSLLIPQEMGLKKLKKKKDPSMIINECHLAPSDFGF